MFGKVAALPVSHICGGLPRRRRAARRLEPPSSGIHTLLADGAARLRFGSAAASRPYHLERRGAPHARAARQRPSKNLEGDALPCSRPARYALRAIYDVLPQHRPVFRLSAPMFAAGAAFASSRDAAARLNLGSAAASRPYHLERRGRPMRMRRGSATRKTWRAMLRRRPCLRRSRLCIPQRRRCAPEVWDDTAVIPPIGTKGGANAGAGAAVPYPTLGYKPSSGMSCSIRSTGAGWS